MIGAARAVMLGVGADEDGYRFYRLYVTEVNEQNSVAVHTLALIDGDGVDVAPSRFIAATASSSGALYPPERVVDPSGYWWSGGSSGLPAWVALELDRPTAIVAYGVQRHTAPGYRPRSWRFEGSNNGVNWKTLDTQTNITLPAGEVRVFELS